MKIRKYFDQEILELENTKTLYIYKIKKIKLKEQNYLDVFNNLAIDN